MVERCAVRFVGGSGVSSSHGNVLGVLVIGDGDGFRNTGWSRCSNQDMLFDVTDSGE